MNKIIKALCHSIFIIILICIQVDSIANFTRPNIVLIVADDLGWNDISLHGSDQILTPNIDILARTGVTMSRYYSHCVCTPSRTALLTGKYAHTLGMQGYPLTNGEDRGIPVQEKLMPQYFKDIGYSTHLVGKWHVGASRSVYTPTRRGFDSHFGHRTGFIDYYTYFPEQEWNGLKAYGLDLYRNNTPAWDVEGYITHVYTNEAKSIIKAHDTQSPLFLKLTHAAVHAANRGAQLQAPPEIVAQMRHVAEPNRRIFAAMVKCLDDSVGDVVEALSEKGILDNTIIVFISDNGAMTFGFKSNHGSNWPLRGMKFTPFEGGSRVAGIICNPYLFTGNFIYDGYVNVVDWLPTLLGAASAEAPENIDGQDLWNVIKNNNKSPRTEFFNFDHIGFYSVVSGDYKLVSGKLHSLEISTYSGGDLRAIHGKAPSYIDAITNSKLYAIMTQKKIPFSIDSLNDLRNKLRVDCKRNMNHVKLCYPGNGKSCLYNIKEDPCETTDLSSIYPEVVKYLLSRLDYEKTRIVHRPPLTKEDLRALPSRHNFTWTTFADDDVPAQYIANSERIL